jgi:hypothetical protein
MATWPHSPFTLLSTCPTSPISIQLHVHLRFHLHIHLRFLSFTYPPLTASPYATSNPHFTIPPRQTPTHHIRPPFQHHHHHTTHQPPLLNADANTAFACLPSTAMREVKRATVCLCTTDSLTPSSVCDLCDRSIQHATPRTNGV